MPYNVAPLDDATIEVLRAWIVAGAPADGVVPGDDGRELGNSSDNPADVVPAPAGARRAARRHRAAGAEGHRGNALPLLQAAVRRRPRRQPHPDQRQRRQPPHPSLSPLPAARLPDGFEVCNQAVDFDKWALVVASQVRKTDWELPPGVAFHFRAGEQLLVQTHFVNVGSLETNGRGQGGDEPAGCRSRHDHRPRRRAVRPGQGRLRPAAERPITDSADCVFPKPIQMFAQTGHYHFRGKRFTTYRLDGDEVGEEIYLHEGYSDPIFEIYDPPLPFAAGQGLRWECYWENPNDVDYPSARSPTSTSTATCSPSTTRPRRRTSRSPA